MKGLPGAELVREGVADLLADRNTTARYLVDIARTRLRRAGLIPDDAPARIPDAELALYHALGLEAHGDAYSRYNALVRQLVSFTAALDHRLRRMELANE